MVMLHSNPVARLERQSVICRLAAAGNPATGLAPVGQWGAGEATGFGGLVRDFLAAQRGLPAPAPGSPVLGEEVAEAFCVGRDFLKIREEGDAAAEAFFFNRLLGPLAFRVVSQMV